MKKKLIITLLLVIGLVSITVGVTYAFFNYTRTGSANTISVGRISFNHTQDGKIELSNVFPVDKNNLNSTNSDTVTINITGDTTYSEGIEYKVTIVDLNNIYNNIALSQIPINLNYVISGLGLQSNNYWIDRGGEEAVYYLDNHDYAINNKNILVGYIPKGSTGINGSINITSYLDNDKIAISDTFNGIGTDEMGTTNDWVDGRTFITTNQWNSLRENGISYRIKVEANEGIWVEKENVLKNLSTIEEWQNIRNNITSLEFSISDAPSSYVKMFDATDELSMGSVDVYIVNDELVNNTYKAIIHSDSIIYAPVNSRALFSNMSELVIFNSNNFKVDKTLYTNSFFSQCSDLQDIDSISNWNTSNFTELAAFFYGCSKLTDIDALASWNLEKVSTLINTFNGCTSLKNLLPLSNWNVGNVRSFFLTFSNCLSLEDASGINDWNINSNMQFANMFYQTPVHPEFTKVQGTWRRGTFTPNA